MTFSQQSVAMQEIFEECNVTVLLQYKFHFTTFFGNKKYPRIYMR